jgi:U3 small nucleolar RNA-associated protein 10
MVLIFAQFLNDSHVGKMVVHKLTSKNTTHWLQVSILTLLPAISRPAGIILDWFMDESASVGSKSVYTDLLCLFWHLGL